MTSAAAARRLPEMTFPTEPSIETGPRRQRRLPATGLPEKRDGRRASSIIALLIHVAVIVLLVGPVASHVGDVIERPQGAGGEGPAGGGGGGHSGTGGVQERVQYVHVTPPPAPAPAPQAVIPPPTPVPQPVVVPPVQPPVQTPEVKPEAKIDAPKVEAKPAEATAPTPGTGGGTGRDGTNGSGPGSGGGVGSGIGTGRGGGVGPGSGGGTQTNYAPIATELFIPPLPVPGKVKGKHMVAEFDVDSTGKVLDFKFTSTGDGGYDRKIQDILKDTRFRPGTTPDGKPIRMKAQITYDF